MAARGRSGTAARTGALVTAVAMLAGATPVAAAPLPTPARLAAVAAPTPAGSTAAYQPIGPLRAADTRLEECGCTVLEDGTVRVQLVGAGSELAGVPEATTAVMVAVSAPPAAAGGYVQIWPAGGPVPSTSVLNLSTRSAVSNSAVVPLGEGGAVDIRSSTPVDLVLDLLGVFTPATSATAGRFQPLAPDRLLDTRTGDPLEPGGAVTVALPEGVPSDATAVAVNITSVGAPRGFFSAHPAGAEANGTSFMNVDGTGAPRAGAVVVPVSADGFVVTASPGGHLIVDITGWFTGESADDSSDGLFVPAVPQRLLDTRTDPPRVWPGGTREIPLPVPAAALVTNVTAVAPDARSYITAYPAGTTRPGTSTLNTAHRNATTANQAIVPVSDRGMAFFSNRGAELVVDLQGWFTGTPVAATQPVPPNTPPVPHVLMIGDSSLGGFTIVPQAKATFQGYSYVYDAEPCRRLVRESCISSYTNVKPNTALKAIQGWQGPFDIVVIKTGYNDVITNFETHVRQIIDAARAKGAKMILWLTYSEGPVVSRYWAQNDVLRQLAASPEFPDLVIADWRTYAGHSSGWYSSDRLHLLGLGVWATGDYISRWIAHLSHLPCPQPWAPGEAVNPVCPSPDGVLAYTGVLPDIRGLYL